MWMLYTDDNDANLFNTSGCDRDVRRYKMSGLSGFNITNIFGCALREQESWL